MQKKSLFLHTLCLCILSPFILFLAFIPQTFVNAHEGDNHTFYKFPFKVGLNMRITQSCVDGIDGDNCAHSGFYSKRYSVDFSCREKEFDILAMADGMLFESEFDRFGYGYYAKILHENGEVTMYAHLARPSISLGPVKQGQKIGNCGNTGNSTGRHLHIERRLSASRFDTAPFFFEECINNSNCFDEQVYYPQSYISTNAPYYPKVGFVSDTYTASSCFDSMEQYSFIKSKLLAKELETCLMETGYLRVTNEDLQSRGLSLSTTPLSLGGGDIIDNRSVDEGGHCRQLIFFDGYQVGYGNDTILALQKCLIEQGFLNIPSPTGYYGNLTREAIGRSKSEVYGN